MTKQKVPKLKVTYSEKLLDPRWQKKRLAVLERCKWKCAVCEMEDKTLHVHHRYYIGGREPWEYPEIALVAVCKDCHDSVKRDDTQRTEWETLLAHLFSPEEAYWDGVDIAYAISKAPPMSPLERRDAIEMLFENADLLAQATELAKARRDQWELSRVSRGVQEF